MDIHPTPKHHGHRQHIDTPLSHTLSLIECPSAPVRFLILDCPTESTLPIYMAEFLNLNVSAVVRCCQPTYSTKRLQQNGISVIDLPFKDGGIPSPHIIHEWLHLIEEAKKNISQEDDILTIAVHCVAGLGRAPVLVAIALIESGMAPLDAIEYIRQKRRGSFNKPQINYLDRYQKMGHPHHYYSSLLTMLGFGAKTVSLET